MLSTSRHENKMTGRRSQSLNVRINAKTDSYMYMHSHVLTKMRVEPLAIQIGNLLQLILKPVWVWVALAMGDI